MLVGKGCWSIFIGLASFVGNSNLSLPCSMADCICCRKILHSFVSWEVALCHLQYFIFFSCSADGIVWYGESLICPSWRRRSKILSAFDVSNPNISGSFLPNGYDIGFFPLTHSARPISVSSSVSTSSKYATFFWKFLRGSKKRTS